LIHKERILIVDYGSQYTQLIARRIRELKVYSEIVSCLHDFNKYDFSGVAGIILSGSPAYVGQKNAPGLDSELLQKGVPVLGVCYGFQLIALELEGKIGSSGSREYGRAIMTSYKSDLFQNLSPKSQVWMSHGDHVETLPKGFKRIGSTPTVKYAAIADNQRRLYGVQFHPEGITNEGSMACSFIPRSPIPSRANRFSVISYIISANARRPGRRSRLSKAPSRISGRQWV
jgi:GMP synthase (glutamine-hydrolysing)